MADSDSEDVPPLEDMSELIHQVEALRGVQGQASVGARADLGSRVISQAVTEPAVNKNNSAPQNSELSDGKGATKSKESFGGMKKGFLFGSNSSKPKLGRDESKKSASEEMPFIKAKDTGSSRHEIPEVQEAMNAGQAFALNKEWVTDDLLQKISQNPRLMNRLADPSFMQAVTEFQTDPQGAMQKYSSNPEMQDFLQDFCKIMGDHLTKLSDKQPAPAAPPSPQPATSDPIMTHPPSRPQITVHDPQQEKEDQRVRELLADPEIREILLDERIQQLVSLLHKDPEQAQRALQMADEKLRQNVHKLVNVGVLQFQK